MITIAILNVLSWTLAAICKAAMDTLQFHFDESVFRSLNNYSHRYFWDPKLSWRNKYKSGIPGKGPKFFLSTTLLVFITDGWHLMQFGMNFFIALTVATAIYLGDHEMRLYQYVLIFITYRVLWGVAFEFFFKRVFIRK